MIRQAEREELKQIYNTRIRADFPPMERRPYCLIRRLFAQGRYVCLVLEENGQVAAYATFIVDAEIGCVFLDYFAVDAGHRGQGVGSRFLSMIKRHWSQKSGIILECEEPNTAKDAGERTIRSRRIGFYQRGGAAIVPIQWRAFGVDYRILFLGTRVPPDAANVKDDLLALYSLSMPGFMRALFTRINAEQTAGGHP